MNDIRHKSQYFDVPVKLWNLGEVAISLPNRNADEYLLPERLGALRLDVDRLTQWLSQNARPSQARMKVSCMAALAFLPEIVSLAIKGRDDADSYDWSAFERLARDNDQLFDILNQEGWIEDRTLFESMLGGMGYFSQRTAPPLPSVKGIREPLTTDLRSIVWNKSGGRCWYCGAQTDPFLNFNVDHMRPVVDGGTNDPSNLVPCCKPCNAAKHAMPIETFRRRRGGGLFWFEMRSEGV